MAILDKLTVAVNKEPFKIFDLSNLSSKQVMFSFNENSTVTLINDSVKYEVAIEKNEKDSSDLDKFLFKLPIGKNTVISNYDDSYYPSTYLIRIHNRETGEDVYKHFKVDSLQALKADDMFQSMTKFISNYSKSFLFDYSKRKYASILENEDYGSSLIDKCRYLKENSTQINSALINIKNNPIVYLEKNVIASKKYGKQNTKSIIKSAIKSQENFRVVTKEAYSSIENSTLKFYLVESSKILAMLSERIDKCLTIYKDLDSRYDVLINKVKKPDTLKRFQKEQQEVRVKYDLFEECKSLTYNFIYKINELLYTSFLDSIRIKEIKLTQKFAQNVNYYLIYNKLYNTLKLGPIGTHSNSTGTNSFGYTFKSTSTLYEIYCLLFILMAIEQNGFIVDRFKNINELQDLEIIESNTCFYYTNGDINIKVIYDKDVERFDNLDREDDELSNALEHSHHVTPDFQILFYDDEYKFLDGIIMDAKCRNVNQIKIDVDNDSNKKIKEQVLDYMTFRYLEKGNPLIKSKLAVKELFLLTPDIELNEPFKDSLYGITYFPIKPSLQCFDSNEFIMFKNLLKDFIDNLQK